MENRNVEIRCFQAEDLDNLQKIRTLAFEPVFRSFREIVGTSISQITLASAETEQAEHLASLCDAKSPQQVFVAVIDERIVGFVSMSLDQEKKIGEIGLNAVHPDHAGRGIGTELYKFALQKMTEAGMLVSTVGTGADPSHAAARRAYQKAGFGPSIPSLWMYRTL